MTEKSFKMQLLKKQSAFKRGCAYFSLPLLLSGMIYGLGIKSPALAAPTIPSATVAALGNCAWTLAGVSAGVTLTAADSYDGTSDALTGTDATPVMFVSGNSTQGTPCSWFSAAAAGATITVSIPAAPAFTAAPLGLGYAFTAANSLTYAPNALGAGCPAATGGNSYTSRSMYAPGAGNLGGATVVYNKALVGTASSCAFAPTYSSLIPGGLTPGGTSTVLTGSGVTTTMTLT